MLVLVKKTATPKPDLAIPYKRLIKNVLTIQLTLINVSAVVIYKNVLLLCKEWELLAVGNTPLANAHRIINLAIAEPPPGLLLVLGTELPNTQAAKLAAHPNTDPHQAAATSDLTAVMTDVAEKQPAATTAKYQKPLPVHHIASVMEKMDTSYLDLVAPIATVAAAQAYTAVTVFNTQMAP